MTEWLGLFLDIILIGVVATGVVQAIRLIRQLQDLRTSRAEMERFVRDFNNAVIRAEAGIKGLRSVARESGDDLEKLVEKATLIRDELNFIVESADGVANRLSENASNVIHADRTSSSKPYAANEQQPQNEPRPSKRHVAAPVKAEAPLGSRAEQELLQALKKML